MVPDDGVGEGLPDVGLVAVLQLGQVDDAFVELDVTLHAVRAHYVVRCHL